MMLLPILLLFIGLAALVSYIWLAVVAFKKSALWGLAVLFLPFANIVFAVLNWEEAKKPFLVNIGCTVAYFMCIIAIGGTIFGMAAQMAMDEDMTPEEAAQFFQDLENSDLFDAEDEAELAEMRRYYEEMARQESGTVSYDGPSSFSSPTYDDPTTPSQEDIQRQRALEIATLQLREKEMQARRDAWRRSSGSQSIPVGDAARYIGEVMRIKGRNGMDALGVLTQAKRNSLVFERRMSGGSAVFEIGNGDIQSLQIVYR